MKVFVVACALLSVAFAQTVPSTEQTILHECFEKDSIACVQQTVNGTNSSTINSRLFQNHLNIDLDSVSFECFSAADIFIQQNDCDEKRISATKKKSAFGKQMLDYSSAK